VEGYKSPEQLPEDNENEDCKIAEKEAFEEYKA